MQANDFSHETAAVEPLAVDGVSQTPTGTAAKREVIERGQIASLRAKLAAERTRYLELRTRFLDSRERNANLIKEMRTLKSEEADRRSALRATYQASRVRLLERIDNLTSEIHRLRARLRKPGTTVQSDDDWAAQRSPATFEARHDELLQSVRNFVPVRPHPLRILSFGCSRGFEAVDLQGFFPGAVVQGCDVNEAALADARSRWGDRGIPFFTSTPAEIAERGPFDLVTVLNVLTRYPDIQELDDISTLYPFASFDSVIRVLAEQIAPGGLLVLYNACYCLEQTSSAALFEPTPLNTEEMNGWSDKFDKSGRKVARVRVLYKGEYYEDAAWRVMLKTIPVEEVRSADIEFLILDQSVELNLKTVAWRRNER